MRFKTINQAIGAPTVERAEEGSVKTKVMRNRYPAPCVECGNKVPADAGILSRSRNGAWEVRHDGPCQLPLEEVKPQEVPEATGQVHATNSMPDGTYTIVFADGDYRTLRVVTKPEWRDNRKNKEVTVVEYLNGPDNTKNFKAFGEFVGTGAVRVWKAHQDNAQLVEAVKVLVADPRAAAAAYGLKSKHCGMCGRELTVLESIERGIGPSCAAKAGW